MTIAVICSRTRQLAACLRQHDLDVLVVSGGADAYIPGEIRVLHGVGYLVLDRPDEVARHVFPASERG